VRSDQITRIDIGLGHELLDLDGRVESSAMSTAKGYVQAIIAHCEGYLPLFLSERARAGRVIRDVLVLVAFRP